MPPKTYYPYVYYTVAAKHICHESNLSLVGELSNIYHFLDAILSFTFELARL